MALRLEAGGMEPGTWSMGLDDLKLVTPTADLLRKQAHAIAEGLLAGNIDREPAAEQLAKINESLDLLCSAVRQKELILLTNQMYFAKSATGEANPIETALADTRRIGDQLELANQKEQSWREQAANRMMTEVGREREKLTGTLSAAARDEIQSRADEQQRIATVLSNAVLDKTDLVANVQERAFNAALAYNDFQQHRQRDLRISFSQGLDAAGTAADPGSNPCLTPAQREVEQAASAFTSWLKNVGAVFQLADAKNPQGGTGEVSSEQIKELLKQYSERRDQLRKALGAREQEIAQLPPEEQKEAKLLLEKQRQEQAKYLDPLRDESRALADTLQMLSQRMADSEKISVRRVSTRALEYQGLLSNAEVKQFTMDESLVSGYADVFGGLAESFKAPTTGAQQTATGFEWVGAIGAEYQNLIKNFQMPVQGSTREEIQQALAAKEEEFLGGFFNINKKMVEKVAGMDINGLKELTPENMKGLSEKEQMQKVREVLKDAARKIENNKDLTPEQKKALLDALEKLQERIPELVQTLKHYYLTKAEHMNGLAKKARKIGDVKMAEQCEQAADACTTSAKQIEKDGKTVAQLIGETQDKVKNGKVAEVVPQVEKIVDLTVGMGQENKKVKDIYDKASEDFKKHDYNQLTAEDRAEYEASEKKVARARYAYEQALESFTAAQEHFTRTVADFHTSVYEAVDRMATSLETTWVPVLSLYLFGRTGYSLSEVYYYAAVQQLNDYLSGKGDWRRGEQNNLADSSILNSKSSLEDPQKSLQTPFRDKVFDPRFPDGRFITREERYALDKLTEILRRRNGNAVNRNPLPSSDGDLSPADRMDAMQAAVVSTKKEDQFIV